MYYAWVGLTIIIVGFVIWLSLFISEWRAGTDWLRLLKQNVLVLLLVSCVALYKHFSEAYSKHQLHQDFAIVLSSIDEKLQSGDKETVLDAMDKYFQAPIHDQNQRLDSLQQALSPHTKSDGENEQKSNDSIN